MEVATLYMYTYSMVPLSGTQRKPMGHGKACLT